MNTNNPVNTFIEKCDEALTIGTFISASLGNYQGEEAELKNIYIKSIHIKNEPHLQFTMRFKTRDIAKNFTIENGLSQLRQYLTHDFKVANCFNSTEDYQYEHLPSGKQRIRQLPASKQFSGSMAHDKTKNRLISADDKNYLAALGITDAEGKVFKKSQDKFRQINHYIEILSTLLKELPEDTTLRVADMGSGKGYLTFALYDYLTNRLGKNVAVQGVEYRSDLVDLCNAIAGQASFDQLSFVEGSIAHYTPDELHVMIALHACDTATDDAIDMGIRAGASLIVVAPCCHKQIRRSMESHKDHPQLDFILRHGILLERQAEMVTDAIRALVLEYHGYKVKVFEFISDAHTPKNVMITAVKAKGQNTDPEQIMVKIKDSLSYFKIDQHHLLRALDL